MPTTTHPLIGKINATLWCLVGANRKNTHTLVFFFFLIRQNQSKTKYISESQCNVWNHYHTIAYCRHTSKQHTHLFLCSFFLSFCFLTLIPAMATLIVSPINVSFSDYFPHFFKSDILFPLPAALGVQRPLWASHSHFLLAVSLGNSCSRSVTVSQFQTLSSIFTSCKDVGGGGRDTSPVWSTPLTRSQCYMLE